MSEQRTAVRPPVRPAKFPWLLVVLLLVTTYVFWILPLHSPAPPVRVDFEGPTVPTR